MHAVSDSVLSNRIGAKKSWNGQYTVECSKRDSLPDFTLNIGGKPYVLKGTDYVLELGGTCVSAFTPMDFNIPGGDLWIVGTFSFDYSSSATKT